MNRMSEVNIPILFSVSFGEVNNNLEIFFAKGTKAFLKLKYCFFKLDVSLADIYGTQSLLFHGMDFEFSRLVEEYIEYFGILL